MKQIVLDNLESCNDLLKANTLYANGKNFRISHLYATAAKSRWIRENLWGTYLAKPSFAWMALWIAVTSRTQLKKRQIRYVAPDIKQGDFIGRSDVFNPLGLSVNEILCRESYLYLFDAKKLQSLPQLDISDATDNKNAEARLTQCGFSRTTIFRRGKQYETFAHASNSKMLVDIDAWQVAMLGVERLVPCLEITLTGRLIKDLTSRIHWLDKEVGEDYLMPNPSV